MRRFLVCSGAHGSRRSLVWLRRLVAERQPDGILFAGGIAKLGRECVARTTHWGLASEDVVFVERFLKTLGQLGIFVAVIPGPAGEPMEEFLRLGKEAELAYSHVHIVHATLAEEGHVAVRGIGGSISESRLIGIDSYSRTEAEYFLGALCRSKQPRKVLLLPAPPPGPLGGLDGDPLVGDLIDSFHPDVCVVAGTTERRGIQRIGKTLVINPGYLSDAWLDWSRSANDQVEFLNLHEARRRPMRVGPQSDR